jgi:hypothetical protein
MSKRAEAIHKAAFWIRLAAVAGFWAFGVYVASFILSMSARGRLDGGVFIKGAATVYVLVWLAGITAFLVAVWKARELRGVQLAQLARMPKPTDPVAASVWPWIKTAWWAWICVMGFIACAIVAGLLGIL